MPLGLCNVTLERGGLDLDERGGFRACWAADTAAKTDTLGLEAFRDVVKAELAAQYRLRHSRDPGTVMLNLASHQFIDDLIGWTRLNWRPQR